MIDKITDKILLHIIKYKWRRLHNRCTTSQEYVRRRKAYEGMVWELTDTDEAEDIFTDLEMELDIKVKI